MSFALGHSKRFPKLALQMISVGEESGALDDMLLRVADTFDMEAKNTVDRMLSRARAGDDDGDDGAWSD